MTNAYLGYTIFFVFAVFMLAISTYIQKRFILNSVDEMLVAGRKVPFGLATASIFVAWVWTTTIMGSSEAGVWYGVSGGFNYSWGAMLPFLIFIPVALRLRKIMPRTTTFVEFIRERFSETLSSIIYFNLKGNNELRDLQTSVSTNIKLRKLLNFPSLSQFSRKNTSRYYEFLKITFICPSTYYIYFNQCSQSNHATVKKSLEASCRSSDFS